MAWRALSEAQFLVEGGISASEQTLLTGAAAATVSGGQDKLPDILTSWIAEVQAIIGNIGVTPGAVGTVPDSIRQEVCAIVRWNWLIQFPKLAQLQTEERKAAWEKAMDVLQAIMDRKMAIEPVDPDAAEFSQAGNSGYEPHIKMRTSQLTI